MGVLESSLTRRERKGRVKNVEVRDRARQRMNSGGWSRIIELANYSQSVSDPSRVSSRAVAHLEHHNSPGNSLPPPHRNPSQKDRRQKTTESE